MEEMEKEEYRPLISLIQNLEGEPLSKPDEQP